MIGVATEQLEFIDILSKRILSLLPNRTGHSIGEVELNSQFIITKNIIDEHQKKQPKIVSYILLSFVKSLEILNKESNYVKLRERDEKSIASTFIICKLLSDLLQSHWNREVVLTNLKLSDLTSNYSRFCYFDRPHPIEKSVFFQIIESLVGLISSSMVRNVLDMVRIVGAAPAPHSSTSSFAKPDDASDSNSFQAKYQGDNSSYTNGIDSHVALILRYVAAANPMDYYEFLYTKIFRYTDVNETVPIPTLQQYSPLIKFVLYVEENAQLYARDYYRLLNHIKSNTWKKVFLVFATSSIQDQSFSRPLDYDSIITHDDPVFQNACKLLYDVASTAFDDDFRANPCSSFVASWLLMLCLEDFIELENEPKNESNTHNNRIPDNHLGGKITNKRLHYLHSILSDSDTGRNIESIDSLIKLFHLGARLHAYNLKEHPILKFCLTYLDRTHVNIKKFAANPQNFPDEASSLKFDVVNINFYTAALMLKPEQYTSTFIQKFEECKDNIKEVKPFVKIIKSLSELEIGVRAFNKLMANLSHSLKSMTYGAVKILKQYESVQANQRTQLSSQSSAGSVYSDLWSVDSSQFAVGTIDINNMQKTSLDHYVTDMTQAIKVDSNDVQSGATHSPLSPQQQQQIPTPTQQQSHQHSSYHHPTYFQPSFPYPSHSTHGTPSHSSHAIQPQSAHNSSLVHRSHSSSAASTSSSLQHRTLLQLAKNTEEMLTDLFTIFTHSPQLYFNDLDLMKESNIDSTPFHELLTSLVSFSWDVSIPIRFAFKSKSVLRNNDLFDAACSLAIILVHEDSLIAKEYTTLSTFSNYAVSNLIIQSICEASLSFSLTNAKFKSCFLTVNRFLQCREVFIPIVEQNEILRNPETRKYIDFGTGASHAIEKVLLLSLCTHDIEFYNSAKVTMKWYCEECRKRRLSDQKAEAYDENLSETFERVINDEAVFTGFVSLHKRFRNILRDAKPTKSLYQVWLLINSRWLEMLENKSKLSDENLIFRHFTGFLVSTSGCFLSELFSKDDIEQRAKASGIISDFFDKCIDLLTSSDLVIRVVIKDALSNESHPSVYQLLANKFKATAIGFIDKKIASPASILYFEQMCVIITSMITIKNDGDFVLIAALPEICGYLLKFSSLIEGVTDTLRLKLRFCKLSEAIELDKVRSGVSGAYKLRNHYAKASLEWLEQSVFYQLENPAGPQEKEVPKSSKDQEIAYLNIDLAAQSSKTLALQLEEIILEIPDGIKDSEIKKYKDLAFGNYFSLFYKIIQKYTNMDLRTSKSKFKLNNILDNVLKCISNILQYDADIGMQFVLPLGYHENGKIRSIFLNVFSNMLASRELKAAKEEFPDKVIQQLSELGEIYGAIAEVASSSEYNLLASSLFGIFSYTKKLDQLFKILVFDEIGNVNRSTDIFRRNSTLTRLLSNFATNHGNEYLVLTLKPFIVDIVSNNVMLEVEKVEESQDTEVYMHYFTKLVDLIVNSFDLIPPSFKFICSEIYKSVQLKFEEASLIAVGSFIFLRFLCPAIISPESFFNIEISNPKVKRTLMQLVKVIQNMANGSLSLLKWPGLSSKMKDLSVLNKKITDFLMKVSTDTITTYPFNNITEKPIPELRYLHKFIYHFFADIKVQFVIDDPKIQWENIASRVQQVRVLDLIAKELGQPKPSIQLQVRMPYKSNDNNNSFRDQYNDFMAKMSMKYVEKADDLSLIHNSIFLDGTPVIVLNLKQLRLIEDDVQLLVYKLFETACQIWDNKFYLVFDFTEFMYDSRLGWEYADLLKAHAPEQFFSNCLRCYYFNISRSQSAPIISNITKLRLSSHFSSTKLYAYSQVDSPEIINSLGLDASTTAIVKDTRVIFNNVKYFDPVSGEFHPVSLRIGRKWIQMCSQNKIEFDEGNLVTKGFFPVDVYKLTDIYKSEVSHTTNQSDEFSIFLNNGDQIILRSNERQEILRFLYFTTSRLARDAYNQLGLVGATAGPGTDPESSRHYLHWIARLYNIVFQGLLSDNDQVKSSSALLFGSLSSYFNVDFGIKIQHSKHIQFPLNPIDFIHQVSSHLAQTYPLITFRFFRAYFDNFDKIVPQNKLTSIIYMSPWINNIYNYVYLDECGGIEKVGEIIRHLCRISAANKDNISIINEYIWKKLFAETRLMTLLIDEVISYSIDSKNDTATNWTFIISIISPSTEVCGEVISRLLNCVHTITKNDSSIALQSKLFEIRILIKVCISLFFNSYDLSKLYLGDIFFLISLFIDNNLFDGAGFSSTRSSNPSQSTGTGGNYTSSAGGSGGGGFGGPGGSISSNEFGSDLQKLCVNMIQSFLHKPNLTDHEQHIVDQTIEYFSDQRAKMLFGLTRDLLTSTTDPVQIYNKILNFEILCDYLNDFMVYMGQSDNDKFKWRIKWCSNSINIAFSTNNTFQGRAILIVGILSKHGISDSIAYKFIKLISKGEHNSLEYITNVIFSMARILQGLPSGSALLSIMIWPIFCFGLTNVSVVYQPAVLCLINTLTKLDQKSCPTGFVNKIFQQRLSLEPLMSYFEMTHNFKMTKENIDIHIFFILTQGLRVSQFKHTSLSYLKKYFRTSLGQQPMQPNPSTSRDDSKLTGDLMYQPSSIRTLHTDLDSSLEIDTKTYERISNLETELSDSSDHSQGTPVEARSEEHALEPSTNVSSESPIPSKAFKEKPVEDSTASSTLWTYESISQLFQDSISNLVFIYLSVDDTEFKEYLHEAGVDSTYIESKELKTSFPSILLEYLASDSSSSKITFIQAAYFFSSESIDNTFTARFLKLYNHLFTNGLEVSRLVYHIIKAPLCESLINNINFEDVDTIASIQVAVNTSEYSLDYYKEKADRLLDENHVSMIRDVKKMKVLETMSTETGTEITLGEDIRRLQVMAYRCACLYVEGSKLED